MVGGAVSFISNNLFKEAAIDAEADDYNNQTAYSLS